MFCIIVAAKQGVDRGGLIGGHAGASPEGHVLLRVRHAGKAGGGFIATDLEVSFYRDDRRQSVADDDHLSAIGQRGTSDIRLGGSLGVQPRRGDGRNGDKRNDARDFQVLAPR